MTQGEGKQVALALYKIAIIEELINKVEVWPHLGPNGIDAVHDLNVAIYALAHVIADDASHSIRLKIKKEKA